MSLDHVSSEKHVTTGAGHSTDPVGGASGCPRCGASPAVGVLCAPCAGAVPSCDGLVPGHISSDVATEDAAGWLIDGFGNPHPIGAGRTVIGRLSSTHLVLLSASVSREHAELRRVDGGWELRDLGSRNRTLIDGKRLTGRAVLSTGSIVRFGEVGFVFIDHPAAMPDRHRSIATAHARAQAARFSIKGHGIELCLVVGDAGGVLLHRRSDGDWADLDLAPLELQLLRVLCTRAVADAASPSRTRGCVPSKQLVTSLAFATDYATEENVRKLVQRARASLAAAGITQVIETVPTRGYYVAWSVALD